MELGFFFDPDAVELPSIHHIDAKQSPHIFVSALYEDRLYITCPII